MIDTKSPGAADASGASEGDWLGGNRTENTKRTSSQQQRDDFDVAPTFSDEAIALLMVGVCGRQRLAAASLTVASVAHMTYAQLSAPPLLRRDRRLAPQLAPIR